MQPAPETRELAAVWEEYDAYTCTTIRASD
jgi:hypothetical protein